jgi:hypothetical protein
MLMAQLNFFSVEIEDGYGIKVLHDPESPIVEYVSIHAFFNDALKNLIPMIVSFLYMV